MTCSLCHLPLPKKPVQETFCCAGCHLIYQILSTQEVKNYQTHPIYQKALSSGLISHPEAPKPELKQSERLVLEIEGMWCNSCARLIELLLTRKKIACTVDYTTDLAIVDYDPMQIGKEGVLAAIANLGYGAKPFALPEGQKLSFVLWLRFIIAAFCGLTLMMFAYPLYTGRVERGYGATFGWLSFALALPLFTYAAYPLWRRLLISLRACRLGMETLVLLGVSSAFIFSIMQLLAKNYTRLYFDSMAMVLVFVLLGNLLEKRAKFSAKESLFRIMRTLPRKVRRKVGEGFEEVFLKEVKLKDILLASEGEKIAFDGVILKGEGALDEAVLTGEARAMHRGQNEHVVGGSLVLSGRFEYEVTDTQGLLGRVIQTIEQQLSHRTSAATLLDRLLLFFVPLVILIALLAQGLNGICVLLIACPCAIGIAIPLAESCLIHRLAKLGVIVRNRAALFKLRHRPFFVFDKTGTLTEGKFQLLTPFSDPYLTALAQASHHPICFPLREGPAAKLDHIEERPGRGMVGHAGTKRYLLGSARLLEDEGICFTPIASEQSILYFVSDNLNFELSSSDSEVVVPQIGAFSGEMRGQAPRMRQKRTQDASKRPEDEGVKPEVQVARVIPLILGDKLRPNLPNVDGMILSGDRKEVVARIGHFSKWKAECDPFEKKAEIEKIQGRTVVMVGDGINDAPAMAAADVSISMHSGSEIACEVADFLISDLSVIEQLPKLSQKGYQILQQNLFWAFAYNAVGICLAAMGYLIPLYAAIAMVLSSLSVTLNSLRLSNSKH